MANQIGWKINSNRCISCRACELACKTEYKLAAGEGRRRRVIEKTVLESGVVRTFFMSLSCNHCANPACIAACPKSKTNTFAGDALYKDTTGAETSTATAGVVLVNPNNCVGCRRCEWACPYGAPQYKPGAGGTPGKIHKCEMCWQRIKAWKTAHPTGDPYSPAAGAETADRRRLPACAAQCVGSAPSAGGYPAIDLNTVDPAVATDGAYVRPGNDTDNGGLARGSKYLAENTLTNPALKIKNRVYKQRDGSLV